MKKIIYSTLIMIILLLPFSVYAYANSNNSYSNGTDVYSNGITEFYINTDDEDKLYKLNLSDMKEEKVLDEHIISMVSRDKYLYLLVYSDEKSILLKFDTENYLYDIEKNFDELVTNIVLRDDIIYYTLNQNIMSYDLSKKDNSVLLDNGNISYIYMYDYNTLKFFSKNSDNLGIYDFSYPSLNLTEQEGSIKLFSTISFTPRINNPPETTNPYYTTWNPFHTSTYISKTTGLKDNYGMVDLNGNKRGNCTCYAYGRAYEVLGSKPSLSTKNAENWYEDNKKYGYYSYNKSTPELGAIAVWSKGVIGNNADGAGHVAFIEAIDGDSVTTSESGWNSFYFKNYTRNSKHSNFDYSSSYTFQGFIYACGTNTTPEEPEIHVHLYYAGIEDVHPHRKYMMCSCGDYYYTGENGVEIGIEDVHPHRKYYECAKTNCPYYRTYTGENGVEIGVEDVHPHRKYYECVKTNCPYYRTYTGENGVEIGVEDVHPHRKYYECAKTNCPYYRTYTGENGLEIGVEDVHPHRKYYECAKTDCQYYRTYTGENATTTKHEDVYPYKEYYVCQKTSCNYHNTYTGKNALPGKPSLNNINNSYLVGDSIKLQWNDTINTTHYNFYVEKLVKGSYERIKTMTHHYATSGMSISFDEAGKYRILLQSTNSNYWTEDKSTWLYTDADWLYFSVSENDIPYTLSTVMKNGNILTIHTELYNFTAPYDILIVCYKGNQFVTMKRVPHNEQNSPYTLEGDIDKIKVMVWDNLSTLKPLCKAEEITSDKFIIE